MSVHPQSHATCMQAYVGPSEEYGQYSDTSNEDPSETEPDDDNTSPSYSSDDNNSSDGSHPGILMMAKNKVKHKKKGSFRPADPSKFKPADADPLNVVAATAIATEAATNSELLAKIEVLKTEYKDLEQEQTECFAKNADLEIEVQTCASNLQLSKATNALLDRRLESTVDARDRLQREYYLQTRKVQTLSDELSTLAHSHHPALYRKMHLGALAAPASVHLFFAPRIVAVDEGGNGVATYVDRSDARSGREFVCDTQSDLGECVAAYAAQIYKQDGAKRPTIDRLADSRHVVLVARAPRYAVLLAPSCTASAADVLKRLSPEDRNINDAADDGRYAPWSRACSEMWTRRYQVFERKHLPSDVRTALAVLFS
eukprot:gene9280-10994_t